MSSKLNIYLTGIFLITFGVVANCQEPSKAILLDEFGELNCEDVIARQDSLFADLQKTPNAVGYAIIFADESNRRKARNKEAMFHGQTQFRGFDDSRFKVIRAADSRGLRIQLWIVPAGAAIPEFQPTDWDFKIDPTRKPFKLNASDYDVGPCPIGDQFPTFSDYLKANPGARAHIVIWARTSTQFRDEKARVSRDLLKKYDIVASRVRFFYFRHRSPYIKWEHWIVPKVLRRN